MGSHVWKFAKIVKVRNIITAPTETTCESCDYSSSSSDSDSGDEMTSPADSLADLEIPVWVGGCEKWITGLTKRTTCDDVIYALLANESNSNDVLSVQTFMMYERWREVERPLRGRTKILKVWRAWGSECRNVKFFIKKSETGYDSGSEIMRTKRQSKRRTEYGHSAYHSNHYHRDQATRKHRDTAHRHHTHDRERSRRRIQAVELNGRRHTRHATKSVGQHMQLEYYGYEQDTIPACAKYPEDHDPRSGKTVDNTKNKFFHHMVKLIIDQEKKLQDQSARIKETDDQIERHETRKHVTRMARNGRNYVQDAYLGDKGDESSSGGSSDEPRLAAVESASEKDLENYVDMCEKIIGLQDKITQEEGKIEHLSSQLVNESQLDWDNHSLASGYSGCEGKPLPIKSNLKTHLPASSERKSPSIDAQLRTEIDKIKHEIERSVQLSIAQQKQLQLVDETLGECEVQLQRKRLVLNQLMVDADQKSRRSKPGRPDNSGATSLSKFKSKSCEMIAAEKLQSQTLETVEPCVKTDDFLYMRRESRVHYNSDSGVESLDKSPVPRSETAVRSPIDLDDIPYVRTVSGKSMVPYFTYATYDKDAPSGNSQYPVRHDGKSNISAKSTASEDTSSDTGLSSLHSDDPSPTLETLV